MHAQRPPRIGRPVSSVAEYRAVVAIPYINALLKTSGKGSLRKLLAAMSIFNPSLPAEDDAIAHYGNAEIKVLADFHGKKQKYIVKDSLKP